MELHPQLKKDCHSLAVIEDICILLNRNASLPWFILVPLSTSADFRELFELPAEMRTSLNLLTDRISQYLLREQGADKINTGAIGNLVSQLHLHVIGRSETDECWPQPIWGNLISYQAYEENQLEKITADMHKIISHPANPL